MNDEVDIASIMDSFDDEVIERTEIIKAPFNWIGGKSRSVEYILPLIPYRNRYCEPFGGSGAVLLARKPSKLEIFNDRYSGITDFYKCVRNSALLPALLDRLELTIHSREEFEDCKSLWDKVEDPVERAAKWYYMVQMSFGSKMQVFGRATQTIASKVSNKIYENFPLFYPCHYRIRNVQIENLDYKQCFKDFDAEDMVFFMDPPYYDTTMRYNNSVDHKELLERIFHLKGFVAISSYDNELYRSYKWDNVYSWPSFVSIKTGNDTAMRKSAKEMLFIKE